jgi:hypothetical protein
VVKPSDFVVEVRNVNFVRLGQIDPAYLDLKFTEVFRSVGSWELKLPAEHPLLPHLKAKGSGVIITRKGSSRPFSGRMRSCVLSQNAEDPEGTWVISGVDDNIIGSATCTYPSPALPANAQTADYWTFTAAGETVMKALVAQNIGATAQASRKYAWLTTATDQLRGATISASTRFDNLGDALTALGTRANLGWRFYQADTGIVFDVFTPADKTGLIRLDIRNGGIESTELGYSAPSASQALVLGQGEGSARTVRPVTSTVSLAEAVAWGLRWEVVKDERNTNDATELEQAGQEILTEQGATINSLKVVPSDAPGQRLGIDWDLGDLITVVLDGVPTSATVTEIARSISSAGVLTQATVGDPVGFEWEAQVGQSIADLDSRTSFLEATIGTSVKDPAFSSINGGGGNLTLGSSSSLIAVPGLLSNPNIPIRSATGTTTLASSVASGANGTATITFPPGRFTQPPFVFLVASNGRVTLAPSSITVNGCTVNASNWSTGTMPGGVTVWYLAVQMTADSSAG